jgi:hypothetical protein
MPTDDDIAAFVLEETAALLDAYVRGKADGRAEAETEAARLRELLRQSWSHAGADNGCQAPLCREIRVALGGDVGGR